MDKNINENKLYKCVNCGEPATALFKTYGPSVLKLTKCDKCKGTVDKYIEYDPVIVMIDLVLMSKEAQRHVLYNIEFKSYWKLLIVLIMLETYGVWRSDSLFNMAVSTVCGADNHTANTTLSLPVHLPIPEEWRASEYCASWARDQPADDADLFIWEKDFYIKFISIFSGIVAFILTVHSSMRLLQPATAQTEVSAARLLKAFSLGHVCVLFSLPALVWGAESAAGTRALHYALVLAYSAAVSATMFTVLYECPPAVTALVLIMSNVAKYTTSFYVTPFLRNFVT